MRFNRSPLDILLVAFLIYLLLSNLTESFLLVHNSRNSILFVAVFLGVHLSHALAFGNEGRDGTAYQNLLSPNRLRAHVLEEHDSSPHHPTVPLSLGDRHAIADPRRQQDIWKPQ